MRLLALLFVLLTSPALAQFADQATYAGASGGTANAQTITVANVTQLSDIQGVLIKWAPSNANTASTTLAVTSTAATVIKKTSPSGLVNLTGGELQANQTVITMYDGAEHVLVSAASDIVSSASLGNSALNFGVPVNLQINASVASSQLTIALVGNNGSNASSSNPILIPFRDVTIANGDPVVVSVQSPLSFVIGSGSTMGCGSAVACRLWIVAINNAGTAALCAFNASSAANIYPINEGVLQTSQSGTSGGSSPGLYYCSASALTSKAIRILGYLEVTETTAGTWATAPTIVQLFGPGIKKPGEVLQLAYITTAASATCNSTSFTVATALTGSITMTSATNLTRVMASPSGVTGSAANLYFQIARGSSPLIGNIGSIAGTSILGTPFLLAMDYPVTTGSQAYTVYCKFSTASGTFNPGTSLSTMTIEEIMGALEPANDNGLMSMVG